MAIFENPCTRLRPDLSLGKVWSEMAENLRRLGQNTDLSGTKTGEEYHAEALLLLVR